MNSDAPIVAVPVAPNDRRRTNPAVAPRTYSRTRVPLGGDYGSVTTVPVPIPATGKALIDDRSIPTDVEIPGRRIRRVLPVRAAEMIVPTAQSGRDNTVNRPSKNAAGAPRQVAQTGYDKRRRLPRVDPANLAPWDVVTR